ncbi:hypothetical protein [Rhodanobacter hydrolyticus]|uniref:Uncharacterized protein n=1 Tax=Rhodanobacter hydrolyticus TaxID=2250595 RepID=A0ABW8J6Y2_9GAMM
MPDPERDGMHALDPVTAARLRQLRSREPLHRWRLAWWVLAVVALLHLVFAALTWWAMRPPAPPPGEPAAAANDVLEVRFISTGGKPAAKAPPPMALPPPPMHATRAPAKRVAEPVSKNALSVQLPAPAPAASVAKPHLFDSNGMPILPAAASSAPAPDYVQQMPQGDAGIMQHTSPVKYQPTRFDKDWGRTSAVTNALQKAVDKTTVKHTFDLGHGIHIHCGISLAALAGGCGGDPPSPPSSKDGDVRMNMAPAKPLAPGPNVPKAPPLSECISLYRAGKPLADGCPSDTPIHAVDQELREQREKQAKQAAEH